jgi:hypothetical protein
MLLHVMMEEQPHDASAGSALSRFLSSAHSFIHNRFWLTVKLPAMAPGTHVEHYHRERNHQGKGNVLLVSLSSPEGANGGPVQCHERLGGLLKYYEHEAA